MRLARVLGAIGRGLISAGVIVLLFVAYQLWGTGLQNAQAQNSLNNEFEAATGIDTASDTESLVAAALASQEAIESGQILANEAETTPEDDSSEQDDSADADDAPEAVDESGAGLIEANFDAAQRQEILAKLYPDPGEAFARIVIPDINVDQISVEGVSVEDLRKGPGHYRTTPNPGQAGNAAIAGHRTTYGAPFHRVDELDPGDSIFVTTAQGVFHYRVLGFENPGGGPERGYFIVSPSDTWVLDQKPDQNILTLTACHPKYSARQRIIVQAELVGEPAPTIPRDEAVELGTVTLDSGSSDERAAVSDAVDGDAEIPDEEQVIIDDDVAADDDPSVDANGDPIDEDDDEDVAEPATDSADGTDTTTSESQSDNVDGTDTTTSELESDTADDADTADEETDAAETDEAVDLSDDSIELVSSQTPLSTDDFGEGLNGDPTKVKPAAMWGIAGLFVWVAAWFMGKRLDRKWTLYAIGFVPFALVLWSAFVNVDQALPSY